MGQAALVAGVGLGVPLGYEGPAVYFGGALGAAVAAEVFAEFKGVVQSFSSPIKLPSAAHGAEL